MNENSNYLYLKYALYSCNKFKSKKFWWIQIIFPFDKNPWKVVLLTEFIKPVKKLELQNSL